jgi:integrase
MKLKGLYRKTDSGVWYYQPPMAKGVRPKPMSLRTKVESEAVEAYYALLADARAAFRRGSLRMEGARFVADRRAEKVHRSTSSAETERILGAAIDLIGNREVADYGVEDMRRLHRAWLARDLSPATIAAYFARLRAFFSWAVAEGLCKANPVADIQMPRDLPTRSEKYCTKEERDQLIATVPPDRQDLALVMMLGFFAGLRRREIDQARRDWIDLDAGVLTVRRTETFAAKSTRGHRTIRLSPRLAAFLADYFAAPVRPRKRGHGKATAPPPAPLPPLQPHDFLVRPDRPMGRKTKTRGKQENRYRFDARRPLEQHVAEQGLPWVSFHTMRHTWATLHALAGTPMTTLAKELGEEAETVFRHYVGYQRESSHSAAID